MEEREKTKKEMGEAGENKVRGKPCGKVKRGQGKMTGGDEREMGKREAVNGIGKARMHVGERQGEPGG
ncbi:MAG: hypothetical protein IKU11_02055 [Clostridia bacterium]|nr:hypothetical protein [Clostridia bacterium]